MTKPLKFERIYIQEIKKWSMFWDTLQRVDHGLLSWILINFKYFEFHKAGLDDVLYLFEDQEEMLLAAFKCDWDTIRFVLLPLLNIFQCPPEVSS